MSQIPQENMFDMVDLENMFTRKQLNAMRKKEFSEDETENPPKKPKEVCFPFCSIRKYNLVKGSSWGSKLLGVFKSIFKDPLRKITAVAIYRGKDFTTYVSVQGEREAVKIKASVFEEIYLPGQSIHVKKTEQGTELYWYFITETQ